MTLRLSGHYHFTMPLNSAYRLPNEFGHDFKLAIIYEKPDEYRAQTHHIRIQRKPDPVGMSCIGTPKHLAQHAMS